MGSITVCFTYDVNGDDKEILQREVCYTNGRSDKIVITNKEIIISGTRSSKSQPKDILVNTKSTFYSQLLKAIVYVYMTSGKKFNLGTTLVTVDGEQESIKTINPCPKDLDRNLIINKEKCAAVFDDHPRGSDLLIAYIWYVKAIQEDEFDELWKSFNSLYSIISAKDQENEKLKDMRRYFENNWARFNRLDTYFSGLTEESVRKLRIREFILGTYEKPEKTNSYAEMVKSFDDYRMAQLFKEVMPYRKQELVVKNLYSSVVSHIQSRIVAQTNRNVDLARFTILKYAYFLRNKYFHAEKSAPVFILTENNEIEELGTIKQIMRLLLSDLMETVDLFMR